MYFSSPKKLKNTVLLLSSLIFYTWGEPKYILLMAISIILGYTLGLLIEKHSGTLFSTFFLSISVVSGLGFLAYFKYANFFIDNFNLVTGLKIPFLTIALPIGISFYTFQILSYTIDVYKNNTKAQKNIISFATYVALFPQLIAGPIVRYVDIVEELEKRSSTFEKVYIGIRRFILGLSKKVLIANSLGELCLIFRSAEEKSLLFYWMYAISFSLQIYFDFSGYSDMAIGLGKIFSFNFLENFNYPFVSKSITQFWRRWHISLGSWFRDYVYIPLGGNRVSKLRWLFNIFVVWTLTGLWHGAAWNFVLWGLMFAILLIIEKLFLSNFLKKLPSAFQHIYVLFFVVISFVIFNASDFSEMILDLFGLFNISSNALINIESLYYLRSYAILLLVAIIGSTALCKKVSIKIKENKTGKVLIQFIEPIVLIALLLLVTAYLVDGSYNPFLYFRF